MLELSKPGHWGFRQKLKPKPQNHKTQKYSQFGQIFTCSDMVGIRVYVPKFGHWMVASDKSVEPIKKPAPKTPKPKTIFLAYSDRSGIKKHVFKLENLIGASFMSFGQI